MMINSLKRNVYKLFVISIFLFTVNAVSAEEQYIPIIENIDFENTELADFKRDYNEAKEAKFFYDKTELVIRGGNANGSGKAEVINNEQLQEEFGESIENSSPENKFLLLSVRGDSKNESSLRFDVKPEKPFFEDFVVEFDFAAMQYVPRDGENPTGKASYWRAQHRILDYCGSVSLPGTASSKIFSIYADGVYGAIPFSNNPGFTGWSAPDRINSAPYASDEYKNKFITVRVATKFTDGKIPTASLYIKTGNDEDFQLIRENIPYSNKKSDGTEITPEDYIEKGIDIFWFSVFNRVVNGTVFLNENYRINFALDNLKVYKQPQIILPDIISDNMIIPDSSQFCINGRGAAYGAKVLVQLFKDTDYTFENPVFSAETTADNRGSWEVQDISVPDKADTFILRISTSGISKDIKNVKFGEIWLFDEKEAHALTPNTLQNLQVRYFEVSGVSDEGLNGKWIYEKVPDDIYSVLSGINEKTGETVGGIAIYDDIKDSVKALSPNGVIYRAGMEESTEEIKEYINSIRNRIQNDELKIIINGENTNTDFSTLYLQTDDNVNIAYHKDDCASACMMLKPAIPVFVNTIQNKAYIVFANVDQLDENMFVKEDFSVWDIEDNKQSIEDVTVQGNMLIVTCNTDSSPAKITYDKNSRTLPNFSKLYTAQFNSMFDISPKKAREVFDTYLQCIQSNAEFTDSSVVLTPLGDGEYGFETKRDYLNTNADSTKIMYKYKALGTGSAKLYINGGLFADLPENEAEVRLELSQKGIEMYVNGEIRENNTEFAFEEINNISLLFNGFGEVKTEYFNIEMTSFKKALEAVFAIDALPEAENAEYKNKNEIKKAWDLYEGLNEQAKSIIPVKKAEKLLELHEVLTEFIKHDENIVNDITVNDVSIDESKIAITIQNDAELYEHGVSVTAAVYKNDKMIKLYNIDEYIPAKSKDIKLELDADAADGDTLYILVTNGIKNGYLFYEPKKIILK
ncbi:MAG: hypothetical protein SOZ34_08495 [Clostridia bacterium]|nr:hypothetical protein [Clostridia bacterium]